MGEPILTILIIVACFLASYKGFQDYTFFKRYAFEVDPILVGKDYQRVLSSAFLHVSWMHLIFNMIALYIFGKVLEGTMGMGNYALLYFGSLLAGSGFALYIHRNHGDYSAVGASGGVSGLVFAYIAMFPGAEIGMIFLPIHIPGWAFGLLYMLYSIYGIRSQRDNIGHEAHFGGAVAGLLIAMALHPEMVRENLVTVSLVLVPALIFLWFVFKRPTFLLVDKPLFGQGKPNVNTESQRPRKKKKGDAFMRVNSEESAAHDEAELNRILDKISAEGMDSLTRKEKNLLDKYSR